MVKKHFPAPDLLIYLFDMLIGQGTSKYSQMAKCSHAKELQNQCRMSVSLMRMIDLKNAQLLRVNHQLEEKDKQLKEGNGNYQ